MSIRKFQDFTPSLGNGVYIDESAQVIGRVSLGDNCSIWPLVTIRGDVNTVTIGNNSNVQDNSVLHVTHEYDGPGSGFPLTIGDNVTIGHGVILHGCTIGNNCLVGMGSKVLDGAVIEDNVFIAAGSLIPQNKRVTSGYLWMGSPAKPIRKLTDKELNWLEYSAQQYVKLKAEYQQD